MTPRIIATDDPVRRVCAAATLQLLLSAASWESLRDDWGLQGGDAVAAVQQAIVAVLEGLRRAGVETRVTPGAFSDRRRDRGSPPARPAR